MCGSWNSSSNDIKLDEWCGLGGCEGFFELDEWCGLGKKLFEFEVQKDFNLNYDFVIEHQIERFFSLKCSKFNNE